MDKPGTGVADAARVEVPGAEGAVRLAGRAQAGHALDHFGVDPAGRVCLDVGASTGGFTDCLLQRGAARVYALDVGYGQLDQRLRNDPRVVVMERINARHLAPDALPEPVRPDHDRRLLHLARTRSSPPCCRTWRPAACCCR